MNKNLEQTSETLDLNLLEKTLNRVGGSTSNQKQFNKLTNIILIGSFLLPISAFIIYLLLK